VAVRLSVNVFTTTSIDARFLVFTTMKIQVVVFLDVTPCSDVVGYQRLGGPICLYLQGEMFGAWKWTHTGQGVSEGAESRSG